MSDFPFKIDELVDVEIEKLTFGGNGLARKNGVVIFVPFSAPGDHLQVKISEIKKRHAVANIEKILLASAERTPPICPVYGICGGCDWQHLSIQSQLQNKQKIVKEFLQKFLPTDEDQSYFSIVPSPEAFRYRNRVQLKFQDGKLGFFSRKSHQVVDIDDCPLMEKSLAEQIPTVKKDLRSARSSPTATSSAEPDFSRIELSLSKGHDLSDEDEGFSQVNRLLNQTLITTLKEWMKPLHVTEIFDLYAGSGNFTFPLLDQFPKARILAAEMHAGAVNRAREKLAAGKISPKRCEFFSADVALFLKRIEISANAVVLLDPPRVGCTEQVIDALAGSRPQRIFYISCNPAALSRDLERLFFKTKNVYRLIRAQAFDMFPQTHHVETLVEIGQ